MAGEPVIGDPGGFGRYGVIDITDLGILCHECGQRFSSLAHHIGRGHGMRVEEWFSSIY